MTRSARRSTIWWWLAATVAYDACLLAFAPPEGLLDARIAYGPADIAELFARQGADGRRAYAWFAAADLGFIAVYTTLFVSWLRWLRGQGVLTIAPRVALVLPLFDLLETTAILLLLRLHPAQPAPLAWCAAVATPLKWLSLGAAVALVLRGELRLRKQRRC